MPTHIREGEHWRGLGVEWVLLLCTSASSIFTHGESIRGLVFGALHEQRGPPVTPTLTHTTGLTTRQAVGVGRATSQPDRDTMSIFVDNDSRINV